MADEVDSIPQITLVKSGGENSNGGTLKDRRDVGELYRALKLAREYIYMEGTAVTVDAVYRSPATALREQADQIDKKSADINKIDLVIKKYAEAK